MTKKFDPGGVELFRMFGLVNSKGQNLWQFRPLNNEANRTKSKVKRKYRPRGQKMSARVEELRNVYDILEPLEISPFS